MILAHLKTKHHAKSKTGNPRAFYYDKLGNRYTREELSELVGKSMKFTHDRINKAGMSVDRFLELYGDKDERY